MLKTLDVHKVYRDTRAGGPDRPVVRGVSFDINPGDFVAIIGPSGSGKTTLLAMVAGLLRPTQGDIIYRNFHINRMSRRELAAFRARHLGIIFQFSELVQDLTVRQNILLPALFARKLSEAEYKKRADSLIERLRLSEVADYLPLELSGGQTQLTAIARSLINEPEFLLADEPSGDLDPGHSKIIKNLFSEYNKRGLTLLLITHDMKLAFGAKTVYHMEAGQFQDVV